jgi:hypothetical protein
MIEASGDVIAESTDRRMPSIHSRSMLFVKVRQCSSNEQQLLGGSHAK